MSSDSGSDNESNLEEFASFPQLEDLNLLDPYRYGIMIFNLTLPRELIKPPSIATRQNRLSNPVLFS